MNMDIFDTVQLTNNDFFFLVFLQTYYIQAFTNQSKTNICSLRLNTFTEHKYRLVAMKVVHHKSYLVLQKLLNAYVCVSVFTQAYACLWRIKPSKASAFTENEQP